MRFSISTCLFLVSVVLVVGAPPITGQENDAATQPATGAATQPTTQPAPQPAVIARARRIVSALLAGDVAGFRGLATARMNAQFEDGTLRRMPETIAGEHGALIAHGEPWVRYTRDDPSYSIVNLPVFMERGTLSFSVVVTAQEEVSGFRIAAFAPRGDFVPPPMYVVPERFREVKARVESPRGGRSVTLSLPVGGPQAPAVVLVGAPAPFNRNDSLGSTHILRDIALGLAMHGIAAIRFDELVPEGDPISRLPAPPTPDAVAAAVTLLKGLPEVDPKRVHVLAHGLAGDSAARGAKEAAAAGVVYCGVPARRALDVVIGFLDTATKLDAHILPEEQALLEQASAVRAAVRRGEAGGQNVMLYDQPQEEWRRLDQLDAAGALEAALAADDGLRALVVVGGRDMQAGVADLAAWHERLAKTPRAEIRLLPEIDHVLSAGDRPPGAADYLRPRPVAAELVAEIAQWVLPGSTTQPAAQAGAP